MREDVQPAKRSFNWQWPVIAITVAAILGGIQMLRVNKREVTGVVKTPSYSTPGTLLSGTLKIGGGEFLSNRITLNRRAKLSGEFQTGSVKLRVAVLVVDEANFEKWKQDLEFDSYTATGYVPGGRISPVLGPGTYFLIVDNRSSEKGVSINAEFVLE